MLNKDGQLMKLGKKPAPKVPDPRNLKLADYLKKPAKKALPDPVVEASWITKLAAAEPIPMYANDVLGDCVEAAAGHMIQQWNFYAGHPWRPTDQDIIAAYSGATGYVPGDPTTDNGTDMPSFLKYWQKTGVGGHRILAYMTVDWTIPQEVQVAIQLFGNTFTGIQLPVFSQGKDDWTVPDGGVYSDAGQPGSWGGHGIPVVAGSQKTRTCETWGTTLKMSDNFMLDYVDEMWAVLSSDWLSTGKVSPGLIDLPHLESDLSDLGVLWKRVIA
jgi:hypothetical protein